jgi:hypothetical protein
MRFVCSFVLVLYAGGCDSEAGSAGGADAGGGTAAAEGGSAGGAAGGGAAGGASGFAHCAQPPQSTCTLENTCAALDCGSPTSLLDAEGCLRSGCTSDAGCKADERCVPSSLYTDCVSGPLEWCYPTVISPCECSQGAACDAPIACVRSTLAPESADCDLAGLDCAALASRKRLVGDDQSRSLGAEVQVRLDACAARLDERWQVLGCS